MAYEVDFPDGTIQKFEPADTNLITSADRKGYERHDFYPFGVEQTSSIQEVTNYDFDRNDGEACGSDWQRRRAAEAARS